MPATRRSKSERGVLGLLWLICFCISLSSRESQSPQSQHTPGQQKSNTQSLTTDGELDQKNSEARQASARADELRALGRKLHCEKRSNSMTRRRSRWISVSDFANAMQTTLKSGDVYFLLNEYPRALERYQKADTLADKTGDWLTKATAMARMARVQSLLGRNDLAQQNLSKRLSSSSNTRLIEASTLPMLTARRLTVRLKSLMQQVTSLRRATSSKMRSKFFRTIPRLKREHICSAVT